jgi:peptidyl-prolyl cis-trans isomerase SurA
MMSHFAPPAVTGKPARINPFGFKTPAHPKRALMRCNLPMNKIVAYLCLLLAGIGVSASVSAQLANKESLDKIVAIAEDEVILQSDLDAAVAAVMAQYKGSPQQLPPRDVLEKQVLESLIMLRLQVQRAQSTGIRVSDADIDQAMQRVAEKNKISVSQLRGALAQQGMDFDSYRKSLRDQLLVQRMQQRVVQGQSIVSDSEVDILLASNSLKEGEVHLQHILISVPEGASAQQIQEAKEKADSVKKQLDNGMDFTTATIQYSGAPDALQGGDLGWRHYDEVPEAFGNLVEGMAAGGVSQPVRGPSGFHIVKLVDKRSDSKQVVTEYHARHILIKVGELTTSDEAQKTVADIRHRIVDGHEDFAALAKKFSQDVNSAQGGGDLGWFQADQYGTNVANALVELKDNEISPPFQSEAGWHIIQRLGTRQQDLTDTMKREHAREVIRSRKSEDEYENFLRQVRSESYVENRLTGVKSMPDADKSP